MKDIKIILITGASSGIGKALAELYAAPDITLLLFGRDQTRLQEIAQICQNKGAKTDINAIDVRDKAKLIIRIKELDKNHPIDLLIASAGVSAGTAKGGESLEQVEHIMDINLYGLLNSVYPVIELMKKRQKGQIALLSSLAALRSLPSAPAYSASKAAVQFFGESMRIMLKADNIKVNIIYPGYIDTAMTKANNFYMPFLMPADKAAQIIRTGLQKNKAAIGFPFLMYNIVRFLATIPRPLSDIIYARLPKK